MSRRLPGLRDARPVPIAELMARAVMRLSEAMARRTGASVHARTLPQPSTARTLHPTTPAGAARP